MDHAGFVSVVALLWLVACGGAPASRASSARSAPGPGAIDLATARSYLAELDAVCSADAGKLWGRSLCGPVLLVDPESRQVVSNRADAGKVLSPREGVFVGTWPNEEGIANTAVAWQGQRWTMIMWGALDGAPAKRRALMLHEAFHRIQPDLGLEPKDAALNRHLDERDARYWLQLEWNALQAALRSEAKSKSRAEAVADALTFRAARRARFPDATAAETTLEAFEGLAEYTGQKAAGWATGDTLAEVVSRRGWTKSFVRGFAYVSGPLYGALLDDTGAEWRSRITLTSDLGALLAEREHVEPRRPEEAAAIATRHGGVGLAAAEDERERARVARIAEWRTQLVDGPVLILDQSAATSGSFDPNQLYPLGDAQTVCTHCAMIAAWGTLTVEDGFLLKDERTGLAHVSIAGADVDARRGKGWSLELAKGWAIVPGERAGDRKVVKR